MAKICFVCGFLGAGKTTVSKKLTMEYRAEHLNADNLCMKLHKPEEYETNWEDCFSKTMDVLWQKAEKCALENKNIIFDIGFWDKKSRKDAFKKAISLGLEPKLYYVYAPDEILKQRIAIRSGAIAEYNLKNFEKLKLLFEEPKNDEPHIRVNNY